MQTNLPSSAKRKLGFSMLMLGWLGVDNIFAGFSEDWAKMATIVPRDYVCYHTIGPMKIDGVLDEASWLTAPWTQEFVDIEGDGRPKPRFRTRAKMLWDDYYFYVGAELEEPHVWGTLTNHDAVIFHDNDFEVFIDPNGDNHEYYEFEINALNTSWDLFLKKPYKDGGPAMNQWEIPGLKTAVRVKGTLNHSSDRDEGWTVEIAFPWKVLAEYAHRRTPPGEGDQWHVNFSRVEWLTDIANGKYQKIKGKREDNWVWSPQGIIDMHRPERWGYVQFTKKESSKAKFVPDPAALARDTLHQLYYAQRDYHEKHKRWAASMEELGLSVGTLDHLKQSLVLRSTNEGFEVTLRLKLPNGRTQYWHIRQDAHVWSN
jgi:cellulose/xylan binding protein with CBM9 domain